MRDAAGYQTPLGEEFASVTDDNLAIAIDRIPPLEEARTAHEALEGRRTTGKVLLATGAAVK